MQCYKTSSVIHTYFIIIRWYVTKRMSGRNGLYTKNSTNNHIWKSIFMHTIIPISTAKILVHLLWVKFIRSTRFHKKTLLGLGKTFKDGSLDSGFTPDDLLKKLKCQNGPVIFLLNVCHVFRTTDKKLLLVFVIITSIRLLADTTHLMQQGSGTFFIFIAFLRVRPLSCHTQLM